MKLDYWRTVIESNRISGSFLDAESWNTCAIGERDRQLRGLILEPEEEDQNIKTFLSEKAFNYGCKFMTAIVCEDKEKALKIIEQIENLTEKEFYLY